MNVLHLYPDNDSMIRQHVSMLQARGTEANGNHKDVPAIVHVHGCWNYAIAKQAEKLRRKGARLVFTPHGGLEPWIIRQHQAEKTTKKLLWQRLLVKHAYLLIAHGPIEAEALDKLAWNPRIETVRNAVITKSITPEAMEQQTFAIYQKVMDSHPLQLMSDDTKLLLQLALKAGITGDKRWVEATLPTINETEWRRLLVYADLENVRTTLDSGLRILNISQPYIDTSHIQCYLPTNYQRPKPLVSDCITMAAQTNNNSLTLRHLVDMDRNLRQPEIDDDNIADALNERSLTRHFQRLLQLMKEQTLLDEGFMPLPSVNDKQTKHLRNLLTNHLRI